jgi:hypothetical protein
MAIVQAKVIFCSYNNGSLILGATVSIYLSVTCINNKINNAIMYAYITIITFSTVFMSIRKNSDYNNNCK